MRNNSWGKAWSRALVKQARQQSVRRSLDRNSEAVRSITPRGLREIFHVAFRRFPGFLGSTVCTSRTKTRKVAPKTNLEQNQKDASMAGAPHIKQRKLVEVVQKFFEHLGIWFLYKKVGNV